MGCVEAPRDGETLGDLPSAALPPADDTDVAEGVRGFGGRNCRGSTTGGDRD